MSRCFHSQQFGWLGKAGHDLQLFLAYWETVAGPLGVNSWTFFPSATETQGFYRVFGE